MELQTISQVAKKFSVSTRTIRYYEQIGLLSPVKKGDSPYRTYDAETITRLHQIIVLRKLRIPLKQIAQVLQSADTRTVIETFERNLEEIEDEITALSTIRSIIKTFIEQLGIKDARFVLTDDVSLMEVVDSLTVSKNNLKDKSMEQLNLASQKLSSLEDKDVRIVYLPPMTVAAAYASGNGCEEKSAAMIKQFVIESSLLTVKPDARSFGFDCSKGDTEIGVPSQAYEAWVSVPDGMDVPAPLIKRTFIGGLYAAHVLRTWDFEDWRLLGIWVNESDKYDADLDAPRWLSAETTTGLEETLNFYHYVQTGQMDDLQLDLLFPVKEKNLEKI